MLQKQPLLTELILHSHYNLHLVQAVQPQIFHEMRRCLKLEEREKKKKRVKSQSEIDVNLYKISNVNQAKVIKEICILSTQKN